jgi:hypothetical protein
LLLSRLLESFPATHRSARVIWQSSNYQDHSAHLGWEWSVHDVHFRCLLTRKRASNRLKAACDPKFLGMPDLRKSGTRRLFVQAGARILITSGSHT